MRNKIMRIEDLQIIIDNTRWDPLGGGSFNSVSVSRTTITIDGYTARWVLKKPNNPSSRYSNSSRAVRKWKELNPEYPAFKTHDGWITPYFGNHPASDEQIAGKLIDIYQKTKIIVIDAYCIGTTNTNFLFL